jgi:hypothetical protein
MTSSICTAFSAIGALPGTQFSRNGHRIDIPIVVDSLSQREDGTMKGRSPGAEEKYQKALAIQEFVPTITYDNSPGGTILISEGPVKRLAENKSR